VIKYLIILVLFFVTPLGHTKETLPADCSHLGSVTEANFVLFNKKELMQLGECLAITYLKKTEKLNLVKSCNEVDEDRRNFLGILSLSKLESILIGQCVGAINYVYEHYHNENVGDVNGSIAYRKIYRCIKGEEAIDVIRQSPVTELDRREVRHLLCKEVYNE